MRRKRTDHLEAYRAQWAAAIAGVAALVLAALLLGFTLGRASAQEVAVAPGGQDSPAPILVSGLERDVLALYQPGVGPELEEESTCYALTAEERALVERVVMAESGNQPLEGQMAVAQCILNTALASGQRPDAVVLAPNQYADPAAAGAVTDQVRLAVEAVFDRGERVTEEPIRFFYAPQYSAGRWHETALEYVMTIGGHKFFKAP